MARAKVPGPKADTEYSRALLESDDEGAAEAYDYLQGRGIQDSTISRFGLGYVLDAVSPDHAAYQGWLSIPYYDARAALRFIRFRRLDSEGATGGKYKQPYGTHLSIYNIVDSEEDHVCITEGEFDTLVLTQCGMASVAIPGTNSWREYYKWLFRDAELVSIIMDPDEEGDKAADRIFLSLASIGVECRKVELPFGQDVSDLYVSDEEGLKELLRV